MKKITSILLIINLILLLVGCGNNVEEADNATNVTVFEVLNNDIKNEVSYTGEIKASEESYVSAKSAGTIKAVYHDIGDYVNAGDTLATIDDTDYRLGYNQALAAYNQALAAYNSVTNGSLKQSTIQLETAVSSAQIEYNNANDNYIRQKALYDVGAISKLALETAETRLKNAELSLNTAKSNYDITINSVNKDSELSAKASVDAAKAALDSAENSLNNTIVVSPISGYVASRNANIGQISTQGSPIFTIKSSDEINVEISVTESIIPYIEIGTEAIVNVTSAGINNIIGKVSEFSTVKNDTTGMYTVRIKLDNKDNKLKIGMFADVILSTQKADEALIIPTDAIMIEDDKYYVYTTDGEVAEKCIIVTGVSNDEYTQVLSGINKGDKVVVSGKEYLSEKNNKVKIIEE